MKQNNVILYSDRPEMHDADMFKRANELHDNVQFMVQSTSDFHPEGSASIVMMFDSINDAFSEFSRIWAAQLGSE